MSEIDQRNVWDQKDAGQCEREIQISCREEIEATTRLILDISQNIEKIIIEVISESGDLINRIINVKKVCLALAA